MRRRRGCTSLNRTRRYPMTEIFLMIVPYLLICGVLGTAAYVMVEIFGDSHRHQH
jgi:hypothetical protein